VDRGRRGSKHHLLVDATGIPLAWKLTGGNRNDVTQLIPLVDAVPAVRGALGRPRRRPERVSADRGYDHDKYRRLLWQRGIKPVIARRQTEHGSGLGRYRWVVERTFAWLHNFKRLLVRYERRADMHRALLALGCCLVCFRRLRNSSEASS
jgi:transposase